MWFHRILLVLRETLVESDIPSATTMKEMIKQAFNVHMHNLKDELKVRLLFITYFLALTTRLSRKFRGK
jgi:hypothetical protein